MSQAVVMFRKYLWYFDQGYYCFRSQDCLLFGPDILCHVPNPISIVYTKAPYRICGWGTRAQLETTYSSWGCDYFTFPLSYSVDNLNALQYGQLDLQTELERLCHVR